MALGGGKMAFGGHKEGRTERLVVTLISVALFFTHRTFSGFKSLRTSPNMPHESAEIEKHSRSRTSKCAVLEKKCAVFEQESLPFLAVSAESHSELRVFYLCTIPWACKKPSVMHNVLITSCAIASLRGTVRSTDQCRGGQRLNTPKLLRLAMPKAIGVGWR